MTKLSIIVPVYNVEKYIRPCIESIFRQGLDDADFEVIIVNDGTKDRSMEIISSIISQHKNITVINQENQGLSVARNNGIKKAIGNYILFVDSDDLIVDHCLPFFLEKAIPSNADLIVADFKRMEDYEIDLLYKKPLSIRYLTASSSDEFKEASRKTSAKQSFNVKFDFLSTMTP